MVAICGGSSVRDAHGRGRASELDRQPKSSNLWSMAGYTGPEFRRYVSTVEALAVDALAAKSGFALDSAAAPVLDGQAAATLRQTLPSVIRRANGAFFSDSDLRAAALANWPSAGEIDGSILDPAVGGGDLLIEVAKRLPVEKDMASTLLLWGERLHGRDIDPQLVRLAKARLVLLAATRCGLSTKPHKIGMKDALPGITVGDGLELLTRGLPVSHIVMNPPFTLYDAARSTAWANGRTNKAAAFLAAAVDRAESGTLLAAILPDVIRTGSRYEKLRVLVGERLRQVKVAAYGQFDRWTDIDVFILRGSVDEHGSGSSPIEWWNSPGGETVADRFHVHVGPVVPHRDSELSVQRPYLHARETPTAGRFDASEAPCRAFDKRLFDPPFVVVRRTSRPGERLRGSGTIISGSNGVLVENHLIVLQPKNSSLDACEELVQLLESQQAKQWLDSRIRCRHLTTRALSELPWIHE